MPCGGRGVDPRSCGRPAPRRVITSRERDATHPTGFSPPLNRSWRSPRRKCTRGRSPSKESVLGIRGLSARSLSAELNPAGRLCGSTRLPLSGFTYC